MTPHCGTLRCRWRSRSLIASPLSIRDCRCRGHGSLRGRLCRRNIWSEAQALQGPQRVRVYVPAPSARYAVVCTFAPQGNLSGLTACSNSRTCHQAAVTGIDQRNGSPDRQILWSMTVSLRANATRALPGPDRRAIASAQVFKLQGRVNRVRMTTAASYISVRARLSPHLDMRPFRSISPD